jgi:cobalt transporter subunit CbtB
MAALPTTATLPTPATAPDHAVSQKASVAVQAVLAMLLGVFVVGIAGFSHLDVVHNAAHDTRHSNGFPCH